MAKGANRELNLELMEGLQPGPSRPYSYSKAKATKSDAGQAGEYLVAADLLCRRCRVTKPININGAHDLHAYASGAWRTIQVKLGRKCEKTGTISGEQRKTGARRIMSDILAVVYLPTKAVRYIAYNIPELPEEFR
jgi:hypothetical protein